MRPYLWLTILLIAGAATAAETYRWVDEDGVVHYSDTPRPGAEVVELEEAQTFSMPPIPTAASESRGESPQEAVKFRYRSVEIGSPGEDETLWNIEGVLNVGITLAPQLQPGHTVRLYLDGQAVEPISRQGNTFVVGDVWRGTHTVWAVVDDANGRALQRSDTRTFHVQQTTIARP